MSCLRRPLVPQNPKARTKKNWSLQSASRFVPPEERFLNGPNLLTPTRQSAASQDMSSLATAAAATYVQVQQLCNDLADHIDWSRGHICDLGTTQAGLMADVRLLDAIDTSETGTL
ncbi:hypothetical protein C8J56DRAFT_898905 [Mycena floridula]|nr:hypothetical protein C8J56DRAFT_898905 [Mycena floridula]